MKLKEFESKQLVEGITLPQSFLVTDSSQIKEIDGPVVVKAQTLAGGRGKAGGIVFADTLEEAQASADKLLGSQLLGEKVTEVLLEEKLDVKAEYYVGIMFDTKLRQPVLIISVQGGVDIEEVQKTSPEKVIVSPINYLQGVDHDLAKKICEQAGFNEDIRAKVADIVVNLYNAFKKNDMKMVEINPLVETPEGKLVGADCVIVLDDDANYRREIKFPARTGAREPTIREVEAHKIDEEDYRGVAGKTFIDLDGDIALLTSGGGASMTLLDALISYGGKPANYTEYSGNPPQEKVEKLTRITLNKEGLNGCMVAGVIANFTDIAETLTGFIKALKDLKPSYPIVVRRAGPRDKEAYEMLRNAREEFGLNIHIFDENTPLTKAGEIMVDLSNRFKAGEDTTKQVEGEI